LGLKQHPTIEGVAAVGNLGQCANARSSNALEVTTVQEIVKSYYKSTRRCQTAFIIQAPTNFVPAVAVIRGEQVLFVLIGRKGYVGG